MPLCGTDYYGRDTLSRLIWGARISLTIGLLAIGVAMIIGSLIGLVAGYFGGKTDIIIMQTMDVLLAFPSLILGLIVVAMLGPSITNLVIAISFTAIPPFARIARAPTMAIKEREFIEAGRAPRLFRPEANAWPYSTKHSARNIGDGFTVASYSN